VSVGLAPRAVHVACGLGEVLLRPTCGSLVTALGDMGRATTSGGMRGVPMGTSTEQFEAGNDRTAALGLSTLGLSTTTAGLEATLPIPVSNGLEGTSGVEYPAGIDCNELPLSGCCSRFRDTGECMRFDPADAGTQSGSRDGDRGRCVAVAVACEGTGGVISDAAESEDMGCTNAHGTGTLGTGG